MFSNEQVKYMKSIGIVVDFSNIGDDDYYDIEAVVSDILMTRGLDKNCEPNAEGRMCESILDVISEEV